MEKKKSAKDSQSKKDIKRDAEITAAFARFGSHIVRIASAIFPLFVLAYLAGWSRARGYYSSFGAQWIVSELSASTVLSLSALPIGIFVLILFLAFLFFAEGTLSFSDHQGLRKFKIIYYVCLGIGIVSGIGSLSLGKTEYNNIAYILVIITLLGWVSISALGLVALVSLLQLEKFKWRSIGIYILLFAVYISFIVGPNQIGNIEGYQDANPMTSKLPFITLTSSAEEGWRLLYACNAMFYIVKLGANKQSLKIRIIEAKEVQSIISRHKE